MAKNQVFAIVGVRHNFNFLPKVFGDIFMYMYSFEKLELVKGVFSKHRSVFGPTARSTAG